MKTAGVTFATMFASFLALNLPVEAQPFVPDFTGVYGRDVKFYPTPYTGEAAKKQGYNNEYLKPWVVELLRQDDLLTSNGQTIVTAHTSCYPEGVPYAFGGSVVQILQGPSEVVTLFRDHGQWRSVHLNRSHPRHVVPSWFGDSVGHFEGDTLVVDTVGIAVNPQTGSMGFYGTPHTEALHLVERYRFLADDEKSMAPPVRNRSFDAADVIKGGKTLRLTFTVEDPGAYKKPWSSTLDFLPLALPIKEYVCAENSRNPQLAPMLPTAEIPDF